VLSFTWKGCFALAQCTQASRHLLFHLVAAVSAQEGFGAQWCVALCSLLRQSLLLDDPSFRTQLSRLLRGHNKQQCILLMSIFFHTADLHLLLAKLSLQLLAGRAALISCSFST
jgi:hypothetical protein